MDKFATYYSFLVSENAKYNLTSITDRNEVYIKHFEDSLSLEKAIDFTQVSTLCDIGSGAGFPAIPLKIQYPHLKITIIEPTLKKCQFITQLILKLDLNNVIIRNERAESVTSLREAFDVVTARAVSQINILSELCIPYVKVGGVFIAMKGSQYAEELDHAKNALEKLSSIIDKIVPYSLSQQMGDRHLIVIKKKKPTDKLYPRMYSQIKKKPL